VNLEELDDLLGIAQPAVLQNDSRPQIDRPRGPCVDPGIHILKPGDHPKQEWEAWISHRTNFEPYQPYPSPVWLYLRTSPTQTVRYGFANEYDARRFYAWNMSDAACLFCCSAEAVRRSVDTKWRGYCVSCRELLQSHQDLERRYERACRQDERTHALLDRMRELGQKLGDGEATQADKAAVLDRLLAEAGEVPA
jgi:hypothetical protein